MKSLRPFLISAAVMAGSLMAPPAVQAQVSAEQVLTIGRNVLAMDDYMLSIQYFNQAIKAKPYLADPYYYRGLAKLMLEDYRGAETDCSMAIERNSYKTEPYRVRGFARMRLGKDSLAVQDFDYALAYAPHDKYFLYYKGISLSQLKDYASADSVFSQMLTLHPRFTDGYTARAQVHLLASDTIAALADIASAIELGSTEIGPRLMRADISLHRRDWAQACEDLDYAIRLTPREGDLYVNRAYARYNADDWDGAMADYNYALDLDPENRPARYNRALLRSQVQDLNGARIDFTKILEWDPGDLATRYNRGLLNLELDNPRAALADFQHIAKRYPRFYPIYYAMMQAYRAMGNEKMATDMFFKANDLIDKYTTNPRKFKLDRPTIRRGDSEQRTDKQQRREYADDESVEEVMNAFTSLVTISKQDEVLPAFGDKIKGRVQDVNMRVEPESFFALSFVPPINDLRPGSNYFRELDEINSAHWLTDKLYLSPTPTASPTSEQAVALFAIAEEYAVTQQMRPIDYLARATAQTTLKNYEAALADTEAALQLSPDFVSALLQRAFLRVTITLASTQESASAPLLSARTAAIEQSLADLDRVLALDAANIYALHNKGYLLYLGEDYRGAIEAFTEALRRNPDFGDSYYNRGLAYLRLGDKAHGVADISRAGELGIVPAYNLLKRLK